MENDSRTKLQIENALEMFVSKMQEREDQLDLEAEKVSNIKRLKNIKFDIDYLNIETTYGKDLEEFISDWIESVIEYPELNLAKDVRDSVYSYCMRNFIPYKGLEYAMSMAMQIYHDIITQVNIKDNHNERNR